MKKSILFLVLLVVIPFLNCFKFVSVTFNTAYLNNSVLQFNPNTGNVVKAEEFKESFDAGGFAAAQRRGIYYVLKDQGDIIAFDALSLKMKFRTQNRFENIADIAFDNEDNILYGIAQEYDERNEIAYNFFVKLEFSADNMTIMTPLFNFGERHGFLMGRAVYDQKSKTYYMQLQNSDLQTVLVGYNLRSQKKVIEKILDDDIDQNTFSSNKQWYMGCSTEQKLIAIDVHTLERKEIVDLPYSPRYLFDAHVRDNLLYIQRDSNWVIVDYVKGIVLQSTKLYNQLWGVVAFD